MLILSQSSLMLPRPTKQLKRIDLQSPARPLSIIKVYGKLSRGLSGETTEPEIDQKEKGSESRAKNENKCR